MLPVVTRTRKQIHKERGKKKKKTKKTFLKILAKSYFDPSFDMTDFKLG